MRRDTVAGTTTMVGMITDMTMGTIVITITITITAMITATQQQAPQPQAPGAPCPSPWWPRGMCTAPTATTTTDSPLHAPGPPRAPARRQLPAADVAGLPRVARGRVLVLRRAGKRH